MDAPTLPTRRQFVAALAAAGAGLTMPNALRAWTAPRTLDLLHTHTGEALLGVQYFSGAHYRPDALQAVNHHLRDWRTGEAHPIDPALLDLLHDLARATGTTHPFQVISGFRSPATNARLRQTSSGVASSSLHMQGKAIDIRLADVPLTRVRAAALGLRRGGVGYYPSSNFVHVDTGRVRAW